MTVSLIWAQARGGVIGDGGGIPWRVPEDMAHFREVTGTGTVVMGRRTWESLPPRFRPLPGRRNVVVTRQPDFTAEGADVTHTPESALALSPSCWVIGGGELYRRLITHACVLEVTELDLTIDGDTLAPAIDTSWRVTATSEWAESAPRDGQASGIRYRFLRYEREL